MQQKLVTKNQFKVKSKIDLRQLAIQRGQNIKEFSESCGVSTQSMAQYMRGSLSETTIYKIAEKLDIDPRDMFFPTNDSEEQIADEELQTSPQLQAQEVSCNTQETMFCPRCGTKFVIVNTPNDKEQ